MNIDKLLEMDFLTLDTSLLKVIKILQQKKQVALEIIFLQILI